MKIKLSNVDLWNRGEKTSTTLSTFEELKSKHTSFYFKKIKNINNKSVYITIDANTNNEIKDIKALFKPLTSGAMRDKFSLLVGLKAISFIGINKPKNKIDIITHANSKDNYWSIKNEWKNVDLDTKISQLFHKWSINFTNYIDSDSDKIFKSAIFSYKYIHDFKNSFHEYTKESLDAEIRKHTNKPSANKEAARNRAIYGDIIAKKKMPKTEELLKNIKVLFIKDDESKNNIKQQLLFINDPFNVAKEILKFKKLPMYFHLTKVSEKKFNLIYYSASDKIIKKTEYHYSSIAWKLWGLILLDMIPYEDLIDNTYEKKTELDFVLMYLIKPIEINYNSSLFNHGKIEFKSGEIYNRIKKISKEQSYIGVQTNKLLKAGEYIYKLKKNNTNINPDIDNIRKNRSLSTYKLIKSSKDIISYESYDISKQKETVKELESLKGNFLEKKTKYSEIDNLITKYRAQFREKLGKRRMDQGMYETDIEGRRYYVVEMAHILPVSICNDKKTLHYIKDPENGLVLEPNIHRSWDTNSHIYLNDKGEFWDKNKNKKLYVIKKHVLTKRMINYIRKRNNIKW